MKRRRAKKFIKCSCGRKLTTRSGRYVVRCVEQRSSVNPELKVSVCLPCSKRNPFSY